MRLAVLLLLPPVLAVPVTAPRADALTLVIASGTDPVAHHRVRHAPAQLAAPPAVAPSAQAGSVGSLAVEPAETLPGPASTPPTQSVGVVGVPPEPKQVP